MRICVIGCGDIATAAHGPALQKYAHDYGETTLAACCDTDHAKADAFAKTHGFLQSYTDWRKMLAQQSADAVLLLAPVKLSAAMAVGILESGVHLMMEKPPGVDAQQNRAIVQAAQKTGMTCAVAFNRRHMPLVKRLKALLEQDTMQAVQCEQYRYRRFDPDFSTTAIHGLDLMGHLSGSVCRIAEFLYQEQPERGRGVTNTLMQCQYDNGVLGGFSALPASGGVMERVTVHGKDRLYLLHTPVWGGVDYAAGYDTPGCLSVVEAGKIVYSLSGQQLPDGEIGFVMNGFYDEQVAFFEAVRNKQSLPFTVESGLDAVLLSNCIRERAARYERKNEWR